MEDLFCLFVGCLLLRRLWRCDHHLQVDVPGDFTRSASSVHHPSLIAATQAFERETPGLHLREESLHPGDSEGPALCQLYGLAVGDSYVDGGVQLVADEYVRFRSQKVCWYFSLLIGLSEILHYSIFADSNLSWLRRRIDDHSVEDDIQRCFRVTSDDGGRWTELDDVPMIMMELE